MMEKVPIVSNRVAVNEPRLSIEISEEQFAALQKLIPHGLKKQLFSVIIDDLIVLLETAPKRELIFAAIFSKMVNLPGRAYGLEVI